MKKIFTVLLLVFLLKSVTAQNFWQKLNSPEGGNISAITTDNANNLYTGTIVSGVYKSTDNGNNWTQANNGLDQTRVMSMTSGAGYVFTGTNGAGVYRSSDNGDSWTQAINGMNSKKIFAMAYNNVYVFAGTDSGVYRSPDGGENWTKVNNGLTDIICNALTISGTNIYVGTNSGVFSSADNGANWTQINNGLGSNTITALGTDNTYLYAGSSISGIYRTDITNILWTPVINGLTNPNIHSITISPGFVYAGTEGGIFRSSNNGNTWIQINSGLTNLFCNTLFIGNNIIFAGTNGGVYRITDSDDTWTSVNNGIFAVNILALSISSNFMYAGANGGIYYSSDNGNNWSETNLGTSTIVYSLTNNGVYIFAGTNSGIFRSLTNANTWTPVNNGLSNLFGNTLTVSANYVFVGTNGGVFRSSNNGNTWDEINNGLSNSVIRLTTDSTYIYAGTNGGGVYRCPLDGNNWEQVNNGVTNPKIRAITTNDGFVYGGSNTGVFRSPDLGDSWSQVNNGLSNLLVTALDGGIGFVYAATDGGGIYRSSDHGDNWNQVNNGLLTPHITTINMSKNGYLYAITLDPTIDNGNGIYKSNQVLNKSITVTAPINGVQWQAGSTQQVVWASINVTENINIKLSTNGGSSFPITLKTNVPNDGNESIVVPNNPSPNCVIKVVSVIDSIVYANSTGKFTISEQPSITVTTPATLEKWVIGSQKTVTWTSVNITGNVNIKLSTDGGSTFPITLKSDIQNDGNEVIDVPANASTACRIKVESVSDNNIFGINPGNFIISNPPSITVITPLTAENWIVGTQKTITWTSFNVPNNVNIKLSIDGGVSFPVTLASNTQNDNTEIITVPDNVSATCRIKIESINDNTIFGLNPGNFIIAKPPSIKVTSPAGSENWVVGSQKTVTWTSVNVSGNVSIKLSTDGGNTFPISVKANISNDGNEVVDVPNDPSGNCKIKVISVNDSTIFGASSGTFTIVLPSITVTEPNASSMWLVGSQQSVKWSSNYITGNVAIKLSTDGGNSFPITIKSNIPNDSSETISVPNNPSTQCVIRVESIVDNNIFGKSTGTFTIKIAPSISVTSPASSANWTIGSQQTVKWSSINVSGNVNIKLSTDGGTSFPIDLKTNTPNDSSENITVPDNASTTCVVKVESVNDTNVFGISNGNFTITSAPTITVLSPAASIDWIIGSQQTVTWTSVNISGNINIKLSTDGGSTFPVILKSNSANDGDETITVPDNQSANCRVKVESVSNTNIFGLNPGDFNIVLQPTITVTSPSSASSWVVGSQQTITWASVNVVGNVNIKLSTDGGNTFPVTLKSIVSNDENEVIDVPNNPSTSCVVKVESVSDTSIFGRSEGNFTIMSEPKITVTTPNSSTNWTVGSQQVVSWNSINVTGNVNIKLSVDGGNTFTIALKSNTSNDGNENITVPNDPSTSCVVKVESVSDTTIFGRSEGNFTITSKPTITVNSPNSSSNWAVGSQQTVEWTSVNVTENINILLSTDGGNTFAVSLKSNIANDGNEVIDVPNSPSTVCVVKVISVSDTTVFGISEGKFTITTEPTISVTSPVASVKWTVNSKQMVTWTSSNVTGNVNIKLSTDGGSTFPITLKSDTQNDGTDSVLVPDNQSTTCRIKVEAFSENNIFGLNPGNFTITAEPTITVSKPETSVQWDVGSQQVVIWTSANISGNINIKLSTDGGNTFPITLKSDAANDGIDTVTVPDNQSATCRLMVESLNNTNVYGLNPGNFVILSKPNITVNTPASAAIWLIGSQQTVEWTTLNVTGNINIKLSVDGGSTFPVLLKANTPNDNSETIQVPSNPSATCILRIESVDDSTIFGVSSSTFSIVSYPATVTVTSSKTFGAVTDIKNYRMIGIPGSGSINVTASGDFQYDWTAYWDNGEETNYLQASQTYKFAPGKAYWVISKNPLSINQQVNTVPLDNGNNTYSIPLHKGWNLISTPFEKSTKWADVITINNQPSGKLLYGWNGGWTYSTVMKPYEGYYYNNDSANFLSALKIPYDPKGTLGKVSSENKYPINTKDFLRLGVTSNDMQENSEVFIGINSAAKNGFDNKDIYAAPADFQNIGIALMRNELPERERKLFIEQRPGIGEGQEYNLQMKTIPDKPIELEIKGIGNFEKYNIYLMDNLNNFYNLKEKSKISLNFMHQYNNFKLYIGTEEYINTIKENANHLTYNLYQNYPNPFNPLTTIRFSVPETDHVTLSVYNILGELVNILINNEVYEAGNYEIRFDGKLLPSGVYIVSIQTPKFKMQKKMILLK